MSDSSRESIYQNEVPFDCPYGNENNLFVIQWDRQFSYTMHIYLQTENNYILYKTTGKILISTSLGLKPKEEAFIELALIKLVNILFFTCELKTKLYCLPSKNKYIQSRPNGCTSWILRILRLSIDLMTIVYSIDNQLNGPIYYGHKLDRSGSKLDIK